MKRYQKMFCLFNYFVIFVFLLFFVMFTVIVSTVLIRGETMAASPLWAAVPAGWRPAGGAAPWDGPLIRSACKPARRSGLANHPSVDDHVDDGRISERWRATAQVGRYAGFWQPGPYVAVGRGCEVNIIRPDAEPSWADRTALQCLKPLHGVQEGRPLQSSQLGHQYFVGILDGRFNGLLVIGVPVVCTVLGTIILKSM